MKCLAQTFLVVQQLGVCLPMQGTWVQSLVFEDSTCCGNQPLLRDFWARARAPQKEKPRQQKAHEPQPEISPHLPQLGKARTATKIQHSQKLIS